MLETVSHQVAGFFGIHLIWTSETVKGNVDAKNEFGAITTYVDQ